MSNKQYSYEEMSNKVISSERRRGNDDENSNPTSLAGQISMKDMGTRATHQPIEDKPQAKKPKKKDITYNNYTYTLLGENIAYRPTSDENAHMFDLIMTQIRTYLPDSSHDVILSAADTVLEVLKDAELSNTAKRTEVQLILDTTVTDSELNELINLANRITDYATNIVEQSDGENEGVAVLFDEEEEEEEEEEESEVEEEPVQQQAPEDINTDVVIESAEAEKTTNFVPLNEIDQFYLQRHVKTLFEDPSTVQEKTTELQRLLSDHETSDRDLENELMELFDYDHFTFIKLLMENRWRIVFRLRLLVEEKEIVLDDMKKLGLDSLIDEFDSKKRKLSTEDDSPVEKKPKAEQKREPKIVDLEALVFDQGSHLMTNSKVRLPQGSFQQNKKSYDIITIPPPASPPLGDEKMVSIAEMPEWAQVVFPSSETASLNRIQSKVYPQAFLSDENLLLCAPTGAGKTNVAMLTVLRTISNYRQTESVDLSKFKVVYIAPLKALVQEQMREFQRRLTPKFGIVVNELTGDSSLSKQQISETQVLVTTPEKWDVITRKSPDYTDLVKLIIIDEIHLLHDERGPVLESIISRTLRQVESTREPVRLVGLSATLPNYRDVASFLRVDFNKGLFYFDSSYRPCPLEQQFISIKEKKAIKKVNAMNEACYDKLVETTTNKHQLIIFVHSRKDTFKTAKWLKEKLAENNQLELVLKSDAGSLEILKQEAENMENRGLKEIIPSGFGIHHAGLNKGERTVVEDLFAQGHLQVLVSTATLAWGVNLPAHTVIIKGTETYSPERGTWIQLSPQDILQMLGRAGRPRYDKSGEGVIITSQDEIQYYLAILNQQLPIESQLMSRLADNLNAEIVLGTVKTREDAVTWLGYTYLYIRMLQSPALYLVGADYADDKDLYWKRTDLTHSALTILNQNKLVAYNAETGEIKSTELGKISSHYYINYSTINLYNNQLKPWLSEIDILKIFASSGEFKLMPVRQEEKLEISKLLEKCPFPVKESPNEPLAKVNVLLQTYISKLKLEGFALMADMTYITQSAGRLLRALYEITLRKNWASLAKLILNMCKMVEKRMWLTNSPLRQFGNVPKEIIRATETTHLPWVSYFNLDAAELAEALNLKGNSQRAYEFLQQFPTLSLSYYAQPITRSLLKVQVEVVPEWKWNYNYHGNSEQFLVLVEDCDGDKILFSDTMVIRKQNVGREHMVEFTVPILDPLQPNYFVSFISEKWLHSEWKIPINLDIKLPKKFPAYTELLDFQNVPTALLKVEEFEGVFDFTYFNKFQSQVFPVLYNSDDSIFVGISKGGGKTVCAELAILNHWRQNKGRVVYINPNQQNIDRLTKTWTKKFTPFSKDINKLTGELAKDISLIGSSHLVLATPEQFHTLSKRWKQRKAVQTVDLLVCDDVNTVGTDSQYEVLIARMRFISALVKSGLRVVALSSPLANGRDFGEWIGCSKGSIFNFDPKERFNKIKEIKIQTSSVNNYLSYFNSLIKPSYDFIRTYKEKTEVFVATRKQAVDMATTYVQNALREEWSLLTVSINEIEPYLKRISSVVLREVLSSGVGFIYEGMPDTDRLIVERLFDNGILTILVCTKETSASAPSSKHIVVLGTQDYDGKEFRYVDYSVNTLLEMVGCSNGDNNNSRVLIFTNTSKLNFYSKFLNEALPVESCVLPSIHDYFINEISTGSIKSKQDCIDWITFTYFYRRLQYNPSFYDVKDTSHLGISEYLSDLVESTLKELDDANLVEIDEDEEEEEEEEEDEDISPLNGTMIASHYNVSYSSMKGFNELDNKSRLKSILEAISSSSEYEQLPVRAGEDSLLSRIYSKLPVKFSNENYESPFFKAFILLQCHFSRVKLPIDLANDQTFVLKKALNLVYACIDTLSSEGYLNAVHSMELAQMIVQAVWNRDSPLKQVPHFDEGILARATKHEVETVYDIMSLEDDVRDEVLQLEGEKLNAVAEFVNKYPNIDILYEIDLSEPVGTEESKEIVIKLERDEEMEDLDVVSQHYPFPKQEGWWIVIGDTETRQLYAIKKTTIAKEYQEIKLEFSIPNAGHHKLSVWCMCDSYVDADKEMTFEMDIV